MTRRDWTAEDDARLRALVADGLGYKGLVVALGRSRYSIANYMRRIGLAFDPEGIEARFRAALAGRDLSRLGAKPGHHQSEATRQKRAATMRAIYENPDYRARHLERLAATMAKRDNAAAGAKSSATKLKWCPAYLRDEARLLTSKRVPKVERRQIIADIFRRDLSRTLKAIAAVAAEQVAERQRFARSFEGQLERARRNGVSAAFVQRTPDFEFSLTGGSLG